MLRRGHRLHSISGYSDLDAFRFGREETASPALTDLENEFLDHLRSGDVAKIKGFCSGPGGVEKSVEICKNWQFIRTCAKEAIGTGNKALMKATLHVLVDSNAKAFEIGEIFILETLNSGDSQLVMNVLDFWLESDLDNTLSENHHCPRPTGLVTPLDVIHTTVYFAANRRPKQTQCLELVQSVVYYATVDQQSQVLRAVLKWHDKHCDQIGQSVKLNADCVIHAALEDDRERLNILYEAGYRLGTDTDRRINKDYLKRIKLFRARASPTYKSVVFEHSKDIYKDDPLKKCFEYARQARINAAKIQDFTKEYTAIAKKCEEFAKSLLDRCTTKHEVQTLLQTKSYRGHPDANFNIAILDGHKEFVAHEKFQQLLHKKWGQQDRQQPYRGEIGRPSYNLFWSEKSGISKLCHIFLQMAMFFVLPIILFLGGILRYFGCMDSLLCSPSGTNLNTNGTQTGRPNRKPGLASVLCRPFHWLVLQTSIPVNRFLYWETSKIVFYVIVAMTLVDDDDVAWYDLLSVFWILSYLMENFRTIHRLYRLGGGKKDGFKRVFKRWCTFRNLYILATDLVFLLSLILRCVSHFSYQCRRGCPYEGNEIAFIAAAIWSIAALLTFLRSIQGGLMWRQTGPVIISMSYMILDVLVFLFLFVIVYFSFTLSVVYVYNVYSDDRTSFFNTHKSAFKLFFWAMIRTGNPHFADIRMMRNSTSAAQNGYNSSCLQSLIEINDVIAPNLLQGCRLNIEKVQDIDHTGEIEEGIPYIAGNTLWAFYQFTVVIVLLSILRARMVNTYHRVFKEADVQWKFFRASIWWKYLDKDTAIPPPFTVLYFLQRLFEYSCRKCKRWIAKASRKSSIDNGQKSDNNTMTQIRKGGTYVEGQPVDIEVRINDHESSPSTELDEEELEERKRAQADAEQVEIDKREFEKRYKKLMLMLISEHHSAKGRMAAIAQPS